MKRVIIESPFRGENSYQQERNRRYALECMKDSMLRGEAPFLSHLLYTQVTNEEIPDERNLGIELGLKWAEMADLTVVYTDNGISPGMNQGIDHARQFNRPIEYRTLAERSIGENYNSVKLTAIMKHVCIHFGFKPSDLKGRSRKREIIDARHIYCTVARELYPKVSLSRIGMVINRDHCTVIHAIRETHFVSEKRKKLENFCNTKKIQLCLTDH